MRAETPERVLVRPQLAEIQAVRVDVVDLAELAARGDLGEHAHARVVLEQVPDHQHPLRLARGLDDTLGLHHRLRERLLDEAVLAGHEHCFGELRVRWHRRCDDDGVELRVGEQLVNGRADRDARPEQGPGTLAGAFRRVGAAAQLAAVQGLEVACEVRAPVAQARDPTRTALTGASRRRVARCPRRSRRRPRRRRRRDRRPRHPWPPAPASA